MTTGTGTFVIGDFDTTADNGYEFNGYIGEIIIFNRDLSPANKKYVDEYLSYKYKLPMDGLSFGADTLTGGTRCRYIYVDQCLSLRCGCWK